MSPTKLSEDDKQEIVRSYRDPQETTTTLAARFRVSSSTISRLLKSAFSADEYDVLIRQKRLNRSAAPAPPQATPAPPTHPDTPDLTPAADAIPATPSPSTDQRDPAEAQPESSADADTAPSATPAAEITSEAEEEPAVDRQPHSWLDDAPSSNENATDEDYDLPAASLWEEDCDSLDEDDDWDEESDEEETSPVAPIEAEEAPAETDIEILPLSAATFPRTCYLVIDRAGELVVKPLKEFQDLGRLPDEEFQQKTLVVFDNHKVARRYSNNRTQRVVKIPDGRLLHKTSFHLQGKGISRILMDGHVYALAAPAQAEF